MDANHAQNVQFDVKLPNIEFESELQNGYNGPNMDVASTSNDSKDNDFPISLIAQKLYNDNNIIDAFKRLYSKYIDDQTAPFMINISSQNRKQLRLSLNDCNPNCQLNDLSVKSLLLKLVTEMDQAAFEVSELMIGSFVRFQANMK